MKTPGEPKRASFNLIWCRGAKHQSERAFAAIKARRAVFLAPVAALLAAAGPIPGPGEPPLTEVTMASGGPIDAQRDKFRLAHVDLAIEVFPDARRITGTATLTLAASQPATQLLVDLDRNLPVRAVAIDGVALPPGAWSNPDGRLAIALPHEIPAGARVTARIAYGGTPHVAVRAPWDDGMVWAKTADGSPWIGTTAEGYGCDLFWPCLDFPAGEPGGVDLHITVPKGLSAPANGVLTGVDTLADGRTVWNWRAGPTNPYGVAISVAPYRKLSADYRSRFGNRVPMAFWYLPEHAAQATELFGQFAPTLDFFEAMVGPYPWGSEKMAIVETPYLGMEHQTINAYGNGFRKTPSGFDEIFQHELAHEWFGNQMTVANWDDYWLHEGYAEYMQPLYGRWREGEARYAAMMADLRLRIANKAPIVSGRVRTEEQVYEEADGGPGADIYMKGAWVLHTLRNLIGDRDFWDVTRRLVYGRPDPRPGNFHPRFGSTAEYEALVRQVTGKDYGWFFDVYLREAALPALAETREGDRLVLRWNVPNDRPFPMPVDIAIDGEVRHVAMPGGTATLDVPRGAHVVIDPEARVLRASDAVEAYRDWQRRGQGQEG